MMKGTVGPSPPTVGPGLHLDAGDLGEGHALFTERADLVADASVDGVEGPLLHVALHDAAQGLLRAHLEEVFERVRSRLKQ